jgi:hypothetical protein
MDRWTCHLFTTVATRRDGVESGIGCLSRPPRPCGVGESGLPIPLKNPELPRRGNPDHPPLASRPAARQKRLCASARTRLVLPSKIRKFHTMEVPASFARGAPLESVVLVWFPIGDLGQSSLEPFSAGPLGALGEIAFRL